MAETTMRISADPAAVWELWLDLARRPEWHPRLEWARLHGPPVPGSDGRWKPRGARPVDVVITSVEDGRRLVLRGTHGLPVARGHYDHEVVPATDGGSLVTHRMRLTGPLAAPIGAAFGKPLGAFATRPALEALAVALGAQATPVDG